MTFQISDQFQTPAPVCEYMAGFIPEPWVRAWDILEPTPGIGQLVSALESKGVVYAPKSDFWEWRAKYPQGQPHFDFIVMNPPFTPMAEGYRILDECMTLSNNVIVLMPWLILINSAKRMKKFQDFGLISVTSLPRKTFTNSRVQCCILELSKGYMGGTILKSFDW